MKNGHKDGCPLEHIPLEFASCACAFEAFNRTPFDVLRVHEDLKRRKHEKPD